ncbi:MAG: hypothetical protein RL219_1497 [Actinomycetota bacterium]
MDLDAVLARCEMAAEAVASLDASLLHHHEFFVFVEALQRHLDQVHVAHARVLRHGQDTGRYIGTGARSMADWVSQHTGAGYGETVGKVRLADALSYSPVLSEAVRSGDVSPATAQALFSAVAAPPEGADVGELVERVKGADPRAARAEVEAWRAEHPAESPEDAEERRHQQRALVFHGPVDGMISGSFTLPTLAARQVQATVASLGGKPSETDLRTTAQRCADGLVLLADAYAKGAVVGGRERATVLVTVPADTLMGGSAAGSTVQGDAVPAHVVRRLAGDARVRRVLTAGSEVLDLGRSVRWATTSQWEALVARDGGCRWEHCSIPATWCDVDHFVAWEHGGTSDLDNLWLLCRHHHTERHRPGVTLTGTVHEPQLTLADGTTIACPLPHSRPRSRRSSAAA